MPIPLIIWAAAAVGTGYIAYKNREKIAKFFRSEDGQRLLESLNKVAEGTVKPYKDICDKCLSMHTTERIEFLRDLKMNRMDESSWSMLVSYCNALIKQDITYFAVSVDIDQVNNER